MANPRNTTNLEALKKSLSGASSFYLVNYQGLTSSGLGDLRSELRKNGAKLLVAKNTLIRIALEGRGAEFANVLEGPTALVLVGNDAIGPIKTLTEFAKKNDKGIPVPKGGVLDGAKIDANRFSDIAKLPSRDELRAELLGVLEAPASGLVSVLGAKQQELVGILEAKVAKG